SCFLLLNPGPQDSCMDTISGDGDCGLTPKAGTQGVEKAIKVGTITGTDLVVDIVAIAKVAETKMGGTSGLLYSCNLFFALAQGIQSAAASTGASTATPELWSTALSAALKKLSTYTHARARCRALVDPLAAFVNASPPVTPTPLAPPATAAKK
ncbi:hypothetical protein B0H14DRAFT_2175826, partial [Mycena olivaceomarginata]